MAMIKTPDEINKMREGGHLLSGALGAAVAAVQPGVTMRELDVIAERVIRQGGGTPSFQGYKTHEDDEPFPSTLCISRNEEIVHGRGDREMVLEEGDIVGLDIGCWYEGLCTDMAVTVPVGTISAEAQKLIDVTRESCVRGIHAAKVGGLINDIGAAVEAYVKPHGYGIVRSLVGHGVGHKVHEAPHVPNFVSAEYPKVKIKDGMCLAVEPMLGLGTWKVKTADDGWTVVMADGKLGAHFELTIAVTEAGMEILTPWPL